MSQVTDWSVDNAGGAAVRAQMNGILAAIQGSNSGATAPSPTVAGMLWLDTSGSPAVLKQRNNANSAWLTLGPETVPATTVRGNSSGSAAAIADISMSSLRTMLGFAQLLASNGYETLPGGLIIQWFLTSGIASGANSAVTLPLAFPNAIFGCLATYANTGGDQAAGSVYVAQVRAQSLTSVTIRNLGPLAGAYFCIALGY